MMKLVKWFLLLLLCLGAITSCEKEDITKGDEDKKEEYPYPEKIRFSERKYVAYHGDTLQYKLTVDYKEIPNLTNFTVWSEDESIATIDKQGNIIFKQIGSTKIKCQYDKNQTMDSVVVISKLHLDDFVIDYLIVQGYDTNNDGAISVEEAAKVDSIDLYNSATYTKKLSDFKYFKHIKKLSLSTISGVLDLSNYTKLKSFGLYGAGDGTIIFDNNPLLEAISVGNGSTGSDFIQVGNCINVQQIIFFSHPLSYHEHYGKVVDLSGCPNLERIYTVWDAGIIFNKKAYDYIMANHPEWMPENSTYK